MLFRKNVISVDILTQNEEDVLELITGCFSQVVIIALNLLGSYNGRA